jgi:2-polyprenyl-6-hydroxyphenyl methylase/3-demethylubiquinone-9 3-methyltransferase
LEPAALDIVKRLAGAGSSHIKVFDAGCGNGALLARLQESGYSCAGCDLSESGVRIARRALHEGTRIEQRSVCSDLSAEFGSDWDVVIATEVIEHVYEPRLMLDQLRALTKPGGWIVLSTPYHGYVKNLLLAATGAMDRHFTVLWDGGHIKFWSRKTLGQLMQEKGLVELGFRGVGRAPFLWKSMFMWGQRSS